MSRSIAVRLSLIALLTATLSTVSLADKGSASSLGMSKTKPADGPSVQVESGFMVPYTAKIPGTDLQFEMIPVPGGTFKLGSPESEEGRADDEGPQVQVNVDPMWVAKTEVNWEQYEQFMNLHYVFQGFQADGKRMVNETNRIDAVTAPTPLYEPSFTYEFGQEPDLPATTMTQYAAQQFTKWLSGISGQQYRLPTEAEWEYAARAGTETAFSWGDTDAEADDHAWSFDNSDSGPSPVGTKKPNAFGLHDMHGSVGEWTINKYEEKGYASLAGKSPINATDAVTFATEESPCVIRGGTWEDDVALLRSAARMKSEDGDEWKDEDPNEPKSMWWYTNDPTRGVGFRLFRSFKPLPKETITKFWDTASEDILDVVEFKLNDGRAYLGLVDPTLPDAIEE
ncbi:MAG: formylglycine-generating enzyme family protein [Rubripirellula sp.]